MSYYIILPISTVYEEILKIGWFSFSGLENTYVLISIIKLLGAGTDFNVM